MKQDQTKTTDSTDQSQKTGNQRAEIEAGFDFLLSLQFNSNKRKVFFWRYFFRYLKVLPLFIFIALCLVFNVDSSGGETIVSEMQGSEKYLYACIAVLMLYGIFALLAALMLPPVLQCEFEDKSYRSGLDSSITAAGELSSIVKTQENLKILAAKIKNSVDNSNEHGVVLLTFIASIGLFIASFPNLIGLKLIDHGVLTPLVSLAAIYLLNLFRVELASQTLKRRAWLLIAEVAQNLKSEQQQIYSSNKSATLVKPNLTATIRSKRLMTPLNQALDRIILCAKKMRVVASQINLKIFKTKLNMIKRKIKKQNQL